MSQLYMRAKMGRWWKCCLGIISCRRCCWCTIRWVSCH